MKRLALHSLALIASAAACLGAQQPAAATPVVVKLATPLDGIAAVVGDQPITRYDLLEQVYGKIQRKEVKEPSDSAALASLTESVLDDMIQDELIIQKAKDLKITVEDADITPQVDRQVKDTRARFENETAFRSALAQAGLGAPEEYRRFLMDQFRRQYTREKVIRQLTHDGKIVPINVTDAEINAEYARTKEFIPKKPASVSFHQIILAPQPTAAAKEVARVRAESLLAQLKAGTDFEKLAKRESMDLLTKETGGDLGWARRDQNLPEFNRWLFGSPPFQSPLQPGQLSPVFETAYGFHIVRVDRVQTGEVKARQILIRPVVDSNDVARTRKLADSVAAMLKSGASFDTLAKRYNDWAGKEETNIPLFERDSLPIAYQQAFILHKVGDISVFQIPGSAQNPTVPKIVVAQLTAVEDAGERTLDDIRAYVRQDLAQRGGLRRYIDGLRKQTYISTNLTDTVVPAAKPKP